MNVADKLDKIANLLESRGWTQKQYTNAQGRMCLLGASAELFFWGEQNAPLEYLRTYLDTWNLTAWNDAPGRTQEEVITTLRSAAEKARTIDIL